MPIKLNLKSFVSVKLPDVTVAVSVTLCVVSWIVTTPVVELIYVSFVDDHPISELCIEPSDGKVSVFDLSKVNSPKSIWAISIAA